MPRVTITVPEKTPQPYRFQLDRNSVTLGRGSENDIPINCTSVSGKHAEMRRVPGGYELRDLGSTNGIKIYGARQQVVQLRNGILVKLGDVLFDFLLSDEELSELKLEKSDAIPAQRHFPHADAEPQFPLPKDSTEKVKDDEAKCAEAKDTEPDSEELRSETNGGSSYAMMFLFLILASAAFVAGMEIRSRKDTGNSLIDAIKAKFEVNVAPEKEQSAPTTDETQADPQQPE